MTFYFYDLETSGLDPRSSRIMQFAGQRTDADLNLIGEPLNIFIKLTPDVLPEPEAIMLTGITPQQTLIDGVYEVEFLKEFYDVASLPDTVFVGFNNIRFDDEFMRFLNYRNFREPYEWQWKDGRGRWDLLDVVRMTRALRPDGIEWPFSADGRPINKLEALTSINKLSHDNAHEAMSDVHATIAVAKLIHSKQPELFNYLLGMRDKKKVSELVSSGSPFVYTSGRYPSATLHTTVAVLLASHTNQDALLVYDLRHDPTPFLKMSVEELNEAWKYTKDPAALRLPVKTIKYNRAPAVAPIGVIKDDITQKRIDLTLETINKHLDILKSNQQEFTEKLKQVINLLDKKRDNEQASLIEDVHTVDGRLYEGFISDYDKQAMQKVINLKPSEIDSTTVNIFKDERLKTLLPLFKARNYPGSLTSEERQSWDDFCHQQLVAGGSDSKLAKYFAKLAKLADSNLKANQTFALEELQLYGQSLMPTELDQ